MGRGRRPLPAEVKALKGNPGKRRLALEPPQRLDMSVLPPPALPSFLTDVREQEIYRRVIDDILQRRVARSTDIDSYGRWAVYLHRWIGCKEWLEGKPTFIKQGDRLVRHPMFRDMLDLEHALVMLEDRLGLNPAARQTIIRGLAAMPAAMKQTEQTSEAEPDVPGAAPTPSPEGQAQSPLGFLRLAGKPN